MPIFGLLGWWLFSPAPEPVVRETRKPPMAKGRPFRTVPSQHNTTQIEDQSQQASSVSYDQMMNKGVKAKARRF